MTLEELKKVFDDLKGEGYEEKDILGILYWHIECSTLTASSFKI